MLIDTNVFRAVLDNDRWVLGTLTAAPTIEVPLAVIAELKLGFLGGNRIDDNERRLQVFLRPDTVRVVVPDLTTADVYAELALWSRRKGRVLSNNDLWIAATAAQHRLPLLTFDRDFEVFAERRDIELVAPDA